MSKYGKVPHCTLARNTLNYGGSDDTHYRSLQAARRFVPLHRCLFTETRIRRPLPAVVFFHGGGMTSGDRTSWFPTWLLSLSFPLLSRLPARPDLTCGLNTQSARSQQASHSSLRTIDLSLLAQATISSMTSLTSSLSSRAPSSWVPCRSTARA